MVDAIVAQTRRLQHTTTIYLNDQVALYAKELTDRLPAPLKVAYFVNRCERRGARGGGGLEMRVMGWG